MNLPSSLKELRTKQYQLTGKQRLMVLLVIALTALIITVYMTTTEVAVESTLTGNNSQQTANPPSKPVISTGTQVTPVNQVVQTMRDPFARPPEAKEYNITERGVPFIQNNIPNNVPAKVSKTIAPSISSDNLRLTGIVGNAERRLAVIMSANKSQSYSLNDVIGTYKIVAINVDSVILSNATGKLVLRLESAGQKEGNNGGK